MLLSYFLGFKKYNFYKEPSKLSFHPKTRAWGIFLLLFSNLLYVEVETFLNTFLVFLYTNIEYLI